MQIGDSVTYRGRRYVVVGFTPFSVRPFKVELEDPGSKQRLWTEWPAEPAERASLRLAREEKRAGGDSG
jgi:hypothetical protein